MREPGGSPTQASEARPRRRGDPARGVSTARRLTAPEAEARAGPVEVAGPGLVGGDEETHPVEAVRQVAQLEARGRLAVQGDLLQADPLTERVRPLHVEPVTAVLAGLGACDEPMADAREPEPRLDGDRDDGARLALPRRLV